MDYSYTRKSEPWPEVLAQTEDVLEQLRFVDCTDKPDLWLNCTDNQANCFKRHFCHGSCCDEGPSIELCYSTVDEFDRSAYTHTSIQSPRA